MDYELIFTCHAQIISVRNREMYSEAIEVHCQQHPSFSSELAIYMCQTFLSFLHSVYNGDSNSLSTQAFSSLAASDVMSMSIVKQCQFLDQVLGTEFTSEMLCNPRLSTVDLKKRSIEADHQNIIDTTENHPSQRFIARIARNNLWMKFWDITLDFGSRDTLASLAVFNILCRTVFADRKYPVDTCPYVLSPDTLHCSHLLSDHLDWSHASVTPSDLVDHIARTVITWSLFT